MKLYELDRTIETIIENGFFIDEETGEYFDEEALNQLQIDKAEKLENVLLMVKNYKAEAEAIKTEKDALAKRQAQAEKRAEWLLEYAKSSLNGEDFKTARVAVAYRKSEKVEIEEWAKLPDEYLTFKDPVPKKTELKKALKSGTVIDGVKLVECRNMSVK